jgi:hypothetical protein
MQVSVEELLPPNRIVENMLLIGQKEMPDCRGIKDMGFDPHLLYNREASAKAKISHGGERQGDFGSRFYRVYKFLRRIMGQPS